MRAVRAHQCSIFDSFSEHDIGQQLAAMSRWLDQHPVVCEWVAEVFHRHASPDTGREGLSAEAALRCALLKQYRQLSYEELAFHLHDSLSFRAFARLPPGLTPSKSTLQRTISAIDAHTWERIQVQLRASAVALAVETGILLRIDSTVTDADIHPPTDSSLLRDAMRVMVRLLRRAEKLPQAPALQWTDHTRRARKRAFAIAYTRGQQRKRPLYQDLLKVTRATLGYLAAAEARVLDNATPLASAWSADYRYWRALIEQVIDQTERRVLHGESVPASDKLVSLFETHTDIVKKRRRDVQYGHKLNLSTGRSGLILDVVIERGNPADSERFLPMLERHIAHYGKAPRQSAADGGYASNDNLLKAKELGVEDVAFHKKGRLTVEAMVKSQWVYRKLRNFRAGIEAGVSWLKRSYGLDRCSWKGWAHFQAYVWSSVVAFNLALLTRLHPL